MIALPETPSPQPTFLETPPQTTAVHQPETTVQGLIWTPQGWLPGRLHFGSRITRLEPVPGLPGPYIVPGFIDVHVHGGGGADVMDGEQGVRGVARFHARHGTTSLLATTITNPWPQVIAALEAVRRVRQAPRPGEAAVLGAHLEGPFVSPHKLGAQPPFALLPTEGLVTELLALDVVRVVTLAPELPGAVRAALMFAAAGVRVSLGHTVASAEQAGEVLGALLETGGVVGGTHLFNAMSGLSGRGPGVLGALLAEPAAYCEVILDGHHVHPVSFMTAFRAKPDRTLLITDAMRAAGMPDGLYDLGGQQVQVQQTQARLADGTLAGSLLTLDDALRRAVQAGVEPHRAAALVGQHPAQYLGLRDRGELRPGLRADVVVLTPDLKVERVYVAGVAAD